MNDLEGRVLTPQEFLQLPQEGGKPPPPPAVYDAFVELLKQHKQNGFARICLGDILDIIVAKCGVTRLTAVRWVGEVRVQYIERGWNVLVDAQRKARIEDVHYVFCAEPQLTEEALWTKYHPNDGPMPILTDAQRGELLKMRPGWGGWDHEANRGFKYTERDRVAFMEKIWKTQNQETKTI